jgi:hypothetical protein
MHTFAGFTKLLRYWVMSVHFAERSFCSEPWRVHHHLSPLKDHSHNMATSVFSAAGHACVERQAIHLGERAVSALTLKHLLGMLLRVGPGKDRCAWLCPGAIGVVARETEALKLRHVWRCHYRHILTGLRRGIAESA